MWLGNVDFLLKMSVHFAKAAMPRHLIFFYVSGPISKNTVMTFFSDLYLQ